MSTIVIFNSISRLYGLYLPVCLTLYGKATPPLHIYMQLLRRICILKTWAHIFMPNSIHFISSLWTCNNTMVLRRMFTKTSDGTEAHPVMKSKPTFPLKLSGLWSIYYGARNQLLSSLKFFRVQRSKLTKRMLTLLNMFPQEVSIKMG